LLPLALPPWLVLPPRPELRRLPLVLLLWLLLLSLPALGLPAGGGRSEFKLFTYPLAVARLGEVFCGGGDGGPTSLLTAETLSGTTPAGKAADARVEVLPVPELLCVDRTPTVLVVLLPKTFDGGVLLDRYACAIACALLRCLSLALWSRTFGHRNRCNSRLARGILRRQSEQFTIDAASKECVAVVVFEGGCKRVVASASLPPRLTPSMSTSTATPVLVTASVWFSSTADILRPFNRSNTRLSSSRTKGLDDGGAGGCGTSAGALDCRTIIDSWG